MKNLMSSASHLPLIARKAQANAEGFSFPFVSSLSVEKYSFLFLEEKENTNQICI